MTKKTDDDRGQYVQHVRENTRRYVAEDVGGQRGRKLIFHVHDGDARVTVV